MTSSTTLVLKLLADTQSMDAGIKSINGKLSTFGKTVAGLGAGLGLAVGVSEVINFMGDAVEAASNLSEANAKVGQVFGDLSGEITSFAQTAATSLGMSERAALEATGTFGNLFDALKIGEADTVEMSKALVTLGSDLASFNNTSIDEALTALQSGILGETEPLRRFGVNLSAARVEAYALANGLARSKSEITDQVKVAARYALILEDTANAQGDFNRTADGMANISRTLSAQMEDLQADIGEALLPAMVNISLFIRDDLIPGLYKLGEVADYVGNILGQIGESFETDAYRAQSAALRNHRDELGMTAMEYEAFANQMRNRGWSTFDDGKSYTENVARELAVLRNLWEDYERDTVKSGYALTQLSANWLEAGKAALKTGMIVAGPSGPGQKTYDTTRLMYRSVKSVTEPWKAQWKNLAEWAKDPFNPSKFEKWIGNRADEAIRKANKAAEDGKPKVAARWRAIARAMKSPVMAGLLSIGVGVDEAVQAILSVQAAGRALKRTVGGWFKNFGFGNGGTGGVNEDGSPNRPGNNARGTSNWRGGWSWVGEEGPELMKLPGGTQIKSNEASNRMAGGSNVTYNVTVQVSPFSDPVAVGREIDRVMTAYGKRSGRMAA